MKCPNCNKEMTEKKEFIPSLTSEGGDNWETVFICKACKIKYSDTFDRWAVPKKLRTKLWVEKGIWHGTRKELL